MAFQMSFEAEFYYPDKSEGITIPAILISGDNLVRTYAKVDPGAEFCVFTNEVGRELGLDIESGIPKRMGSLTGTLDTFGHEVTLQPSNSPSKASSILPNTQGWNETYSVELAGCVSSAWPSWITRANSI